MDRIEKLLSLLTISPRDAFLQHALALEYVKLGKDEDARMVFETLLQNEPGYVGSYYHLGKLLERQQRPDAAIGVYEEGMKQAKKAGDQHAYGELFNACEDLT